MRKLSFGAMLLVSFLVPVFVSAQPVFGLQDPLTQQPIVCSIKGFIGGIYYIGMPIAAIALAFAGFLFVQAKGNPQKLDDARKNILRVLFGVGLFLGSWLIGVALVNTIRLVVPSILPGIVTC